MCCVVLCCVVLCCVVLCCVVFRVGVNSGIEWELSSIPDSIPEIGLGIGIEKKGIELELTKNARK